MNAKEYLKSIDIPDELVSIQRDGFIESHYLSTLISKYHLQRSREEAEERYEKGKKILNNPEGNTLPLNMVLDALWLAAYGGCIFCKSGTIQQVGNNYICDHCMKDVK